jgi:DNA invertase Pin-like site-specific DNA recombinase
MNETKVGLIYIRQSRHKDSERTVSPEVQEEACRALPAIQGCDRVEVYVDLDKSGKSIAKRPDFQRFLERIDTNPPAVIAVYDQSRSFRNTTEALDFYALMERMPQVTVVFHLGHFERSPVGEFSYTALAAAHTMERKMTGAKISEAKRYAAARGEMVGAVPAGYR